MAGRIVDAFGEATFAVIDEQVGAPDRGAGDRAGAGRADRRDLGRAAPHPRGDGGPPGLRRLHLAGGAHLQALRRRQRAGDRPRAVPAGPRGLGHRLQDGRQDRPGGRDRPGRPGTAAGRGAPRPRAGRRRGPHPAARARPGRPGGASCSAPIPTPSAQAIAALVGDGRAGRGHAGGRGRAGSSPWRPSPGRSRASPPASRRSTRRSRHVGSGRAFAGVDWAVAFGWLAERHGLRLAPEQEAGVRMVLTSPVVGPHRRPRHRQDPHPARGPHAWPTAKRLRCLLAAPTGRAAKRMSEATGWPAGTLHRVLGLRPGGQAGHGPDHPLEADLVVVDEVSMLDAILANQLAKAVAPGTHLLLVGDPDQLPSVGAGDVLADLLRSERFPVTRLTHIFRQGAGIGHRRQRPADQRGPAAPLRRRRRATASSCRPQDPAEAAQIVVDLVARRLPARYGFRRRRGPGPLADAPGRGRGRCPEHAAPGAAQPRQGGRARGAGRGTGLPAGRPGAAAQERLRPGGLQRRPRHGARRSTRSSRRCASPSTTGGRCATPSPACTS